MLEYLPWSQDVLFSSLSSYKKGQFSVLDIELGGSCNFNCVYCDSPDRNVVCNISMNVIDSWLQTGQFKWVHICGIGEPTFSGNYSILLQILSLCEQHNVKCSMFSNVYNLTRELICYIEKEILYVLFKLDSLGYEQTANLYGVDAGRALAQIENISKLSKLVRRRGNTTNLAASIVPTSVNKDVIEHLIKQMFEIGIFPMIGDLENSGRGRENYSELNLCDEELERMKKSISSMIGKDYVVPQCPAVISSIHINAANQIVVDEISGLSCNWFWLEEPKLKILLPLEQHVSLEVASRAVFDYRASKLDSLKMWLKKSNNNWGIFGGCGGNVVSLLQQYIPIQEEAKYYDGLF